MTANEEFIVTDVTLRSLVRLLKNQGYNLDSIKAQYDAEILDNVLSGAAPQYKHKSIALLDEVIKEA
ncbi:hypothetical protein [Acinetobacter variabilis]|uniref:hypothetical protein n=1 Tax=Acinetobacter variabilis TaxID=70346 RepID=UPI0021C21F3E|nr:hypothetical protein [Acinetobacter variabilis]UXI52707.1 hypothetical protein N5980_07130 [Acinetobacter variabilis]